MAYTKYSLTPANNNAAPPDGAPEGMLPSAVNDTMRDMMAQIRDVGDGIRGGTYTMTAPVITGGSINGTTVGAGTASTGAFTTLSATGATTFSGATVANTFSSSGATITGGSINGTTIGGTTAAAGKFTTLEATGVTTVQAGTVSAPAITTTGDTNTGIFFPAADTIAFTEGGVEAMRITSTGRVLIGSATSPLGSAVLQTLVGGPSGGASTGLQMIYNGSTFGGGAIFASETGGGLQFYTVTGNVGSETYFEKMSILQTGNILSLVGGSKTATGTGITFPATQSASSDANTLDDYEEGTWTPVLTDLTNNATMTSTVGRYIKIGRSVTLQAQVTTSSLGSVTGDIYFSGLPFASEGTTGNYSAIVAGNGGNLAITAGQSVGVMTDIGATILQLFLWDSATGATRMQASEWSSDGQIRFSITYFSAS